jgi:hypothetical protein
MNQAYLASLAYRIIFQKLSVSFMRQPLHTKNGYAFT